MGIPKLHGFVVDRSQIKASVREPFTPLGSLSRQFGRAGNQRRPRVLYGVEEERLGLPMPAHRRNLSSAKPVIGRMSDDVRPSCSFITAASS
jgi:hypothetical protein